MLRRRNDGRMPTLETDLIDVVRARLQGMGHELDMLRARTRTLAAETRWRSAAFSRFAEQLAALGDDLARIDAEADELRHDLLRARAVSIEPLPMSATLR
jgi:hypothetical protein